MNTKLLLLAISAAAFSSCTTMYRSGQTPDDVYYSPVRTYGEARAEVKEERRDERKEVQRDNVKYYDNKDRTIRRGIYDRRWRTFDNDYRYSPYNYGFNYGYYYNPYYWPYPVFSPLFVAPSNPKNTTPRTANLGQYNTSYNNANLPSPNTKTGSVKPTRPSRSYNNNNSNGSAVGNVIRQILTPDNSSSNSNNNSSNSNSSNNSRSYTPASTNTSSSSSSSSGSSSSGSGGVSRPPRSSGN
ncbi:MAG: hypothetical protein ABIN01_07635 [Ferruginibacter sp.]